LERICKFGETGQQQPTKDPGSKNEPEAPSAALYFPEKCRSDTLSAMHELTNINWPSPGHPSEGKVFSAVDNHFGTNFTSANLFTTLPEFQFSTGTPAGQGTLNLNISGSGVSPGSYPVNWWTYLIGYGSTLHIPAGPGGLDSLHTLYFSSYGAP
jgi:hypothetical protein